ncbi:MAG: hypothetical protein D4R83_01915 [Streptomycetaceae bacterium]|nr:MAG: hypothetical protein D4R83_01915 [Streptomycetaceae bacterium]
MRKILILHSSDNVAVCLSEIGNGEVIEQDGKKFSALESIPRGHKIAIANIELNEGIIKYGERMGHAISRITAGSHVHVHNVLGDRLSSGEV